MEPSNAVQAGGPRLPVKVRATARITGKLRDGEMYNEAHNLSARRVLATVAAASPTQLAAACRSGSISRLKGICDDRRGTVMRAAEILGGWRELMACRTSVTSGLCLKDSRYVVDRARDVTQLAGRWRCGTTAVSYCGVSAGQGQNGFAGSACDVVHRGDVICVQDG